MFTYFIVTFNLSQYLSTKSKSSISKNTLKKSIATLFAGCACAFSNAPLCFGDSHIDAKITSQVYLDVSIARQKPERVTLGIYGNDAPAASKFFISLCDGSYNGDVSYGGSQVSKIQKNRLIDVGKFAKGGSKKQELHGFCR